MVIVFNDRNYDLVFSMPMYQEIRSARDRGLVYAYGESCVVWVDFATSQPRSVPEAVRGKLIVPVAA